MKRIGGANVTLIARDVHTPYSGMLPGMVAGHYSSDECHVDLRRLCRFAGASLVHAPANGIDTEAKMVHVEGRPPVRYDVLSIDVGIMPHFTQESGVGAYATPVKPIDGFAERWEAMRQRMLHSASESAESFVITVVGGGAGGVELALAMHYRLKEDLKQEGLPEGLPKIILLTKGELLGTSSKAARRKFRQVLVQRGIELKEYSEAVSVSDGHVNLSTGEQLPTNECIWCTQAMPQQWPKKAGLKTEGEGFIQVDEHLESTSHDGIFAAGDIANVRGYPRPKAGVFAVRQGPPLAENLRNKLLNKPLKPHKPQSVFLSVVSTGSKHAVALYGPLAVGGISRFGSLIWTMKDRIDRAWMSKYNDLPRMEGGIASVPPIASAQKGDALETVRSQPMRCGGCGSKVGFGILDRVLARIDKPTNPSVVLGMGDDAALISTGSDKQAVATIDFIRDFVGDPYELGRVAAVHAMGDCWAMGAEPQAALAHVVLPYSHEGIMEATLETVLAGACTALREGGCALAGGHTSESDGELGVGFSIHGAVQAEKALRKSNLRPGHYLILTKPVGTGVLFAADMRARAKGRWICNALEQMGKGSGTAARILMDNMCTAATDVTGFGVAGHLLEMCRASGVGARVMLGRLPVYEGAREMFEEGITSSLQPSNLRLRRSVANFGEAADDPAFPLLFDPQTAGGLLAAVPEGNADKCVRELMEAGYERAQVIGRVLQCEEASMDQPLVIKRAGAALQ